MILHITALEKDFYELDIKLCELGYTLECNSFKRIGEGMIEAELILTKQ